MAGLALAAMLVFYWDGIVAMVEAWARPEYSFGPLVPLVSAYMLLHEIRRRPLMEDGGSRVPRWCRRDRRYWPSRKGETRDADE